MHKFKFSPLYTPSLLEERGLGGEFASNATKSERSFAKIYPVYFLICATAFVVDPLSYAPYQAPELLLLVVIPLVTLVFACLYQIARRRTVEISVSIIELLLIAELIWVVFGNLLLLIHTENLHLFSMVALIMVVFIARQVHAGQEETPEDRQPSEMRSALRLLIRTIWIVGVCQALIGFAQYYAVFSWLPIGTGKTRMIGLIGAANGFGTIMALAVMALIIESAEARHWKSRVTFLTIALVPFVALVLNGCRGAFLALVAAAIVFFLSNGPVPGRVGLTSKEKALSLSILKEGRSRRRLVFAAAVVVVFGGLSIYLYRYDLQSSLGRLFVWRVSAPMFFEHPIKGVGLGNYSVKYLDYQKDFFKDPANLPLAYKASNMKQALSDYVQVFCETGLVGGLLFMATIGIALWGFFSRKNHRILIGAGSLLLVILIHMGVDTPLRIVPVAATVACLLGLAPVPSKWIRHFRLTPAALGIALLPALLAASVFVGIKCERYYQGHVLWFKGYEFARQHRWQFAAQEYKRALADLPHDGQLLFNLGAVQIIEHSYSEGIYHLQEARDSYNDRNIYLSLSEGYLSLHEYEKAQHYARVALAMFPNQLSPRLILAEIYYRTGRFGKSKESLRRCIDGDTSIRSHEVEQISAAAQRLWDQYYASRTQ